jgi:FkbM family methyltransferase
VPPGRTYGALIWRFGEQVRASPEWREGTGWRRDNLRKAAFAPATVIDVGVGHGTPHLYEAFPEAHHILLEPLAEFEPELRRLVDEHGGEYLLTAIGEEQGTAAINVDRVLEHSTFHELPDPEGIVDRREVPVTTLDALFAERRWETPLGLKVDTEGFEHRVIGGATRVLAETQFVVVEVSVVRSFPGGYTFAEFIALMDERGFELLDVLDGQKAAIGHGVAYIDALFRRRRTVPRDGP